jgi:ribosomal protein S18 acetylase RimI-like enzyme
MAIRPAQREEVSAIRSLVERAYGPWVPVIGRRPGPMDWDYEELVAGGDVHVWASPDPIGLLVLRVTDDGALMVENVAVDPAAQGQGLGRALLAFAEEQAAERDIDELRLYTHERMTSNIELYSRLGFAEYGRVTEHGFARVFMRKHLSPGPA